MKKLLLTAFTLLGLCSASAQTQVTTDEAKSLYKLQSRGGTSIHDPSVVWDASTQTFYIYGSHYAGAKTKDFKNYTAISNYYQGGYSDNSWAGTYNTYKAFQSNPTHTVKRCLPGSTVEEEVTLGSFDAGAFAATYAAEGTPKWVSGCQWAPDIVYNPHMNKWCYYLSINGDNWASVVVLMTSDSPTGPFTYQAPIVFGGFNDQSYTVNGESRKVDYKDTDLEVVLGSLSSIPGRYKKGKSWGSFWPNCIDPCAFFDEDGELWLAYGSWSGGIWMLKLDKQTGLRDYTYTYTGTASSVTAQQTSDAYFGKLIAGGYYVSGEGPYIQHIGDYYYLFMSYGGFAPDGGYEMRVFRSDKPDGPYKDAAGNLATYTGYQLNFGPKAATNRGMKLIGAMNGWGLMTVGETAQGHNSACQDDLGRTFLVCHTKFNDGTLGHAVRAYQLYLNKSGWLCTAPFQFDGETTTDETIATTQPYSAADVEGYYYFLVHPYKLDHANMQEVTPSRIYLSADGKVTGDYTGTWSYTDEGASYIQLKLRPAGSSAAIATYNGVVVEQTLEGSVAKTLCFTAVCNASGSSCGVPCWGYKLQPPYAISLNYQEFSDTYFKRTLFSRISKNVDIMFQPLEDVQLTWTSSAPDVLSSTGKFTPQDESVNFTMTARLSSGNYYWENEFAASTRVVDAPEGDQTTGLVAYYNFDEKPTANLFDAEQTALYGHSSASTAAPALTEDWSRYGNVVHQYFGSLGNNSYTRMPNPLLDQTDLEGFTVSLWVKRVDATNYWDALWGFFGSKDPRAEGARLYLTGNSYLGFNDNAGHWFDVNYPVADETHTTGKVVDRIDANTWRLITLTYSKEDGYTLYRDGSKYLSSQMVYTGSEDKDDFNTDLVLQFVSSVPYFYLGSGSFWGSAEAFFDDLMIYNRALTADDVKGLNTLLSRGNSFDDGTIVGIDAIAADAPSAVPSVRSGIYDLTGRKVTAPAKGIYLYNGKKILIK